MTVLKVGPAMLSLSFWLSGCLFSSTWAGTISATELVWKQVPDTRFFIMLTCIIAWILVRIAKNWDDIKEDGLHSESITGTSILVILAVVVILRAVFPGQVVMDRDKVSQSAGFLNIAPGDTQPLQNITLAWKDVTNVDCYKHSASDVSHWAVQGTRIRESSIDGIKISSVWNSMFLPLKATHSVNEMFETLVGDWILGLENFDVSIDQRELLKSKILEYAPPGTRNSCK